MMCTLDLLCISIYFAYKECLFLYLHSKNQSCTYIWGKKMSMGERRKWWTLPTRLNKQPLWHRLMLCVSILHLYYTCFYFYTTILLPPEASPSACMAPPSPFATHEGQ